MLPSRPGRARSKRQTWRLWIEEKSEEEKSECLILPLLFPFNRVDNRIGDRPHTFVAWMCGYSLVFKLTLRAGVLHRRRARDAFGGLPVEETLSQFEADFTTTCVLRFTLDSHRHGDDAQIANHLHEIRQQSSLRR